MKSMLFAALTALLLSTTAFAQDRPLIGDPVHGATLVKKAKVDGTWINSYSNKQCLVGLQKGKAGFPKISSRNTLDLWDGLAFLKTRNTELEDLFPEADHVLITYGELDQYAEERLKAAKIKLGKEDKKRTLFALFTLGAAPVRELSRVPEASHRERDKLKPKKKIGYVVFMELEGVEGAGEVAIAVDNDVVIRGVRVRAKDGTVHAELDTAAQRFIGRGARGKYEPLAAGGKGKAIRDIQDALSSAYLRAMESVYMYEVRERDYFAFDEG